MVFLKFQRVVQINGKRAGKGQGINWAGIRILVKESRVSFFPMNDEPGLKGMQIFLTDGKIASAFSDNDDVGSKLRESFLEALFGVISGI